MGNMKSVIVTGANGFIGSSFVKKLLDNGVSVVAIDISFSNSRLPESNFLYKIESGIDDVDSLVSIIPAGEYDALYHFAWKGVNGPDKANLQVQAENIRIALCYASICKIIGCRKFLCAGTVAEQSVVSLPNLERTNGGMIYGVSKHCAHLLLETYCKNVGLDFVWMQFSNIYGVGNRTGNLVNYALSELLVGNTASFGPAEQPYDFIYVDDLIEAIYRIGEKINRCNSYFIGSGKPRVLKEYLLRIGELCGLKDKVEIGARADDGIRYDIGMFDIRSLQEDIGEYVNVEFDDGIKKTIDWLRAGTL